MPEPSADAMTCDLLVFDLDGTLIDSQKDLADSVNATLAFLGRPALGDATIAAFIGDGASALLHRALEATGGVDEAHLAEALPFFLAYYRLHNLDFTRCYPGVLTALHRLRDANPSLPMAVLTNKPGGPSRTICNGLGLSEFFFANYGGDSVSSKKPDPESMHALMQQASQLLGREVHSARTVLIGDSHVDVQTARNAGVRVVGCLYGLSPDSLRKSGPDELVTEPHEWPGAIRKVLTSA